MVLVHIHFVVVDVMMIAVDGWRRALENGMISWRLRCCCCRGCCCRSGDKTRGRVTIGVGRERCCFLLDSGGTVQMIEA